MMTTTQPATYPSSPFSTLFNPLRPLTLLSLFLWLLVTLLLISAAGSPTFWTGDGVRFGAFQVCYAGDGCHSIDTQCKVSDDGYTTKVLDGGDCSHLQATRAFLIMGLLLAIAITFLTWIMFFMHRMADRTLYFVAIILMAVESLFILIAFSVAAALINKYDADSGAAFGCLVSAWVFGLLAWALWAAAGKFEQEGVRGLSMGSMGMGAAGMQPKTVTVQSAGDANVNGQQAPAPYGQQPYQPSYQQQYQPQQPYQQQQPQYQPQPQYAPQSQQQFTQQQQYPPQQQPYPYQPQPQFAPLPQQQPAMSAQQSQQPAPAVGRVTAENETDGRPYSEISNRRTVYRVEAGIRMNVWNMTV